VTYTDPAPLSIPTDPLTGQPDYRYLQPVRGTRLIAVKNPNPAILPNEKIAIGTSSFLSQINPTVYVSKPVVFNANSCSLADWPYDNWNNCLHIIEFNDNTHSVMDANDAGVITGTDGSGNVFVARISSYGVDPITTTVIANDIVLDNRVLNCRPVRISQVYFNSNDLNDPNNGNVWVASNCSGNRAFRSLVNVTNQQLIRSDELSYVGSSNLIVVSINSHGVAVGTAIKPDAFAPDGYTALVWSSDPANPIDLNANQAFAPASAWNVHATDINEAGTVLTGHNDTSGNFYTFLLHFIP